MKGYVTKIVYKMSILNKILRYGVNYRTMQGFMAPVLKGNLILTKLVLI